MESSSSPEEAASRLHATLTDLTRAVQGARRELAELAEAKRSFLETRQSEEAEALASLLAAQSQAQRRLASMTETVTVVSGEASRLAVELAEGTERLRAEVRDAEARMRAWRSEYESGMEEIGRKNAELAAREADLNRAKALLDEAMGRLPPAAVSMGLLGRSR